MRKLYSLIAWLLLPFLLLRLLLSIFRNADYADRWPERFGFVPARCAGKPLIWVHAVSVGEVQAALPLINRLLNDYPDQQLLVTTMTPTGALMVQQRFGQAVMHHYLPYDLAWSMRRFVRQLRPGVLIVIETELWPNLFAACKSSGVPILLVNARMSARSARGYARLGRLTRSVLADIDLIAAQNEADGQRLQTLGARPEHLHITGNLKFDIHLPPSVHEQAQALRRQLSMNRPIWIAASTHEGEEKIVLDGFDAVRRKYPDCLLLLAPRHPERFEKVAELCRSRGYKTVLRSHDAAVTPDTNIYLIDTLGELSMCYAAADMAFVGGSLLPIGGHNMLEPASLGVPILTGPHYFNFNEISELLQQAGAAWVVANAPALAEQVQNLMGDAELRYHAGEKGRAVVRQNGGGIEQLLPLLQPYLDIRPAA